MDNQTQLTIDQLAGVLTEQLAAHDRLLALLNQKHQSLRQVQYEQVATGSQRENAVVQQISELEKKRLQLVADLTLALDPQAAQPLKLAELAQRLDEPDRGRLLVLRQQLLERMAEVRRQTNVARRATESLVSHMQGLVQSIGAACSGMSIYASNGAPPPQAMVLSTFNTTA